MPSSLFTPARLRRPHSDARRASTRAFTLIELIVTIVILGILAALAVPAFNAVIERSRDSQATATWEAVVREAQAIAAFEDRGVTAADIAEALGDLAAADGVIDAAGAPYTYVDTDADDDGVADATVGPGEWSVNNPAAPTVLLAADAALADRGALLVASVPSPGVNATAQVRDYDDAGGTADGADTQRHYDDVPTATTGGSDGSGGEAATAQELLVTFDPTTACTSNYSTNLNDRQHLGQSLTVTGSEISRVGFFNQGASMADGSSATGQPFTITAQVYDGAVTDYDTASLLGQGTATISADSKIWMDIDLDAAVSIASGQQVTVLFVPVDFGGGVDPYMGFETYNDLRICVPNQGTTYSGGSMVNRINGSTNVSGNDFAVRVFGQE